MTISTTRGTELTVDELLKNAMQTAGVLDTDGVPADGDLAYGRRQLDILLDSLQAEGVYARSVQMLEVQLTAGEAYYSISSNVIDLVGDGAYIDASNSSTKGVNGETPVQPMSREEWQGLTSKGASGRPYKYWLNRSAVPLQVRLWPTPDEAGTIRFQANMLFADTYDGSATVDARQFWIRYLVFEMAHVYALAKSMPKQACGYLYGQAKDMKIRARAYANQHLPNQMVVMHSRRG